MSDQSTLGKTQEAGLAEAMLSATESPRTSNSNDEDVEKAEITKPPPTAGEESVDPNIVDWEGDDDPEKPINWPNRTKWRNVFTISALTLLTPFGSTMFAPAVPETMKTFHSDNVDLSSFVVSVFVLGYAFGPLVIAPMSELYGRLWVYHINTILFILFNIACALSTSLSMEITFRFLAGFSGVTPLTIGAGTISDMFKQEQRGRVMAIWTFPVLIGPTLGPVVGSYLSEAAGWRWTFWFLAILSGVVFAACLILQRETYPPTLLQRKTNRLQQETGNTKLRSAMLSPHSPGKYFLISIIRPTKLLFLSPIVFFISLYIAVCYGYMYLVFTSLTELFEGQYGISRANVGLTFLGIGVGQFIGLLLFGSMSDKILKAMAKKNGGEMKPEYRLPPLLPGAVCMPIGLLWYGWSAQEKIHWIVPILGTVFVGLSMIVSLLTFSHVVPADRDVDYLHAYWHLSR